MGMSVILVNRMQPLRKFLSPYPLMLRVKFSWNRPSIYRGDIVWKRELIPHWYEDQRSFIDLYIKIPRFTVPCPIRSFNVPTNLVLEKRFYMFFTGMWTTDSHLGSKLLKKIKLCLCINSSREIWLNLAQRLQRRNYLKIWNPETVKQR